MEGGDGVDRGDVVQTEEPFFHPMPSRSLG